MTLSRKYKAGPSLTSSAGAAKLLSDLVSAEQEHVVVLLLDGKHRVMSRELAALGSATSCAVHPRDVFRAAVRANATAVIVAHNHPSGDSTPSGADDVMTSRLVAAGDLLGIPVLDHLIIGASCYSYADNGRLRHGV